MTVIHDHAGMNVSSIYINTHRYDYEFTRICVASVRYWYPEIDIYLIKDLSNGANNTTFIEKKWGIKVFQSTRKKFGWGFGKLEALFSEGSGAFLVMDADTVMTGPVISSVENVSADFLVDEEVQPREKFCRLYYDLDEIKAVDASFIYPGYSFNTGQWFGKRDKINRADFDEIINWTEPPVSRFPSIIFQGEQGHLNFLLHQQEQQKKITVCRKKIMIWPDGYNADFIELEGIRTKKNDYPYIIHWAGMKFKRLSSYPRADILRFYLSFYKTRLSTIEKLKEKIFLWYISYEKRVKHRLRGN